MMKVVLKLSYFDDKIKTKAMKKVSSLSGLDSISFDPKEQKMTVTGEIDPVTVTSKLRKICPADVISVGPAKEPEKKKDEPNKNDGAKDIKAQPSMWMPMYYNERPVYYHHLPPHQYQHQHYAMQMPYYGRSVVEEDPNSCLIS